MWEYSAASHRRGPLHRRFPSELPARSTVCWGLQLGTSSGIGPCTKHQSDHCAWQATPSLVSTVYGLCFVMSLVMVFFKVWGRLNHGSRCWRTAADAGYSAASLPGTRSLAKPCATFLCTIGISYFRFVTPKPSITCVDAIWILSFRPTWHSVAGTSSILLGSSIESRQDLQRGHH